MDKLKLKVGMRYTQTHYVNGENPLCTISRIEPYMEKGITKFKISHIHDNNKQKIARIKGTAEQLNAWFHDTQETSIDLAIKSAVIMIGE